MLKPQRQITLWLTEELYVALQLEADKRGIGKATTVKQLIQEAAARGDEVKR
jgi:hypothetical protein